MKAFLALYLAISLYGCTVPVRSTPPSPSIHITELCIIENPKVLMDGFLPELKSQITGYGIKTQLWSGYNPDGCRYWLSYTANWRFDLVPNMVYAELKLFDHTTLIGYAEFNDKEFAWAHYGIGRADKKLRYLTEALFAKK